ncbi:MAG TPA: L,D-transpeptidase family protein [Gaiellaceae bacterium]|nr:L,D-transpeptidase family protein [Gaiellaceae bacterium]
MRRAVVFGVLLLAFASPAVAAAVGETVSIAVSRTTVPFDRTVHFTGTVSPAVGGAPIGAYLIEGDSAFVVASGTTRADGTYDIVGTIRKPGSYVTRARVDAAGTIAESGSVALAVLPSLTALFEGSSTIGGGLVLAGRLQPARSGTLRRTIGTRTSWVRVGSAGRFRIVVPTIKPGVLTVKLTLTPATGYAAKSATKRRRITLPYLARGSSGGSVRLLERMLRDRHYAIPRVDSVYGYDTVQAVWAFQKVYRLRRTGRVTPALWRLLSRVGAPAPRVRRGNHIEVDKTRQILLEVRGGRVVNVLHVSTGATGNTPVGVWHVYSKLRGYNALGMYYSLFFRGGFAIHGYHSVPSFPASHGCVRIPIWAAYSLFNRWTYGATVRVFP